MEVSLGGLYLLIVRPVPVHTRLANPVEVKREALRNERWGMPALEGSQLRRGEGARGTTASAVRGGTARIVPQLPEGGMGAESAV